VELKGLGQLCQQLHRTLFLINRVELKV